MVERTLWTDVVANLDNHSIGADQDDVNLDYSFSLGEKAKSHTDVCCCDA